MPLVNTEDLLSTKDVALRLGIVSDTVRQMVRHGHLEPVHQLESGHRLYLRQDVERLQRKRAKRLAKKSTRSGAR